jgi:hypothetical protein
MLQHGCGDREHESVGDDTAEGKDIVYQKAVQAAISVFEWMDEHEAVGYHRGMNDGGQVRMFHGLMGQY